MQIIIFFTKSDSLFRIGIRFPWNSEMRIHQCKIIPVQDSNRSLPELQIWVVFDEISFSELQEQLDMLPSLKEVYYVYHNLPLDDFINQLNTYLTSREIFKEGFFDSHIPNVSLVYKEIKRYPFTVDDFGSIAELIYPCSKNISGIMNQLIRINNVLEDRVNLIGLPEEAGAIYKKIMIGVTPENFNRKRTKLKTALEKYCRERSKP
jgi:hypothetical protein